MIWLKFISVMEIKMAEEFYSKEESRYLKLGLYVCLFLLGMLAYVVITSKVIELDNGKY